jgi:hypothetical protein
MPRLYITGMASIKINPFTKVTLFKCDKSEDIFCLSTVAGIPRLIHTRRILGYTMVKELSSTENKTEMDSIIADIIFLIDNPLYKKIIIITNKDCFNGHNVCQPYPTEISYDLTKERNNPKYMGTIKYRCTRLILDNLT